MTAGNIAIEGQSLRSKFIAGIIQLFPASWREFYRGPATLVGIDIEGTRLVGNRRRFRPVTVLLDPALILTRRLALPASARADLASSVELMVLSETPFEPDELLIQITQLKLRPSADEIGYDVHFTPLDRVSSGLSSLGLPMWCVTRIVPSDAIEVEGNVNFAMAAGGANRLVRYGGILPGVILLGTLLVLGQVHLSGLRAHATALDMAVSVRQDAVRSVATELVVRQDAASAQAAIDQVSAESPSIFLLLEQLRANLPGAVSITRLAVDGGTVRLDVLAPDMLQLVRDLSAAMQNWVPSVDGSITRSPQGSLEMGTILLRQQLK